MNSLIAAKLNVLEAAIVRVEEWTHVLFVVVKGLGARFVSKKVIKEDKKVELVTRLELANLIKQSIDCDVKIWDKSGVRCYLSNKGKDYGHVAIDMDGVTCNLSGYGRNAFWGEIQDVAKDKEISEPKEIVSGIRRLSESEANRLASQASTPKTHRDREMDRIYGPNWDSRDLEDYEG